MTLLETSRPPAGGENRDPRPRVGREPAGIVVRGVRCQSCGYPATDRFPRCPVCGGEVSSASFGPSGTVFSSTVVRVPIPGRTPPYVVAYLDLDAGPRVVAHVAGPLFHAIPVGSRARVIGTNGEGDVLIEAVEES